MNNLAEEVFWGRSVSPTSPAANYRARRWTVKSVVAVLTLTLLFGSLAWAVDQPAKPAFNNTQMQQFHKISQDGYSAMRAIRAARMAIFKGQPDMANVLLTKAQEDLRAAAADAATWNKEYGETTQGTRMDWIPIDGWVALGETFIVTPNKQEYVKEANVFLRMGRAKWRLTNCAWAISTSTSPM
jgi:hypothetical protein